MARFQLCEHCGKPQQGIVVADYDAEFMAENVFARLIEFGYAPTMDEVFMLVNMVLDEVEDQDADWDENDE